MASPPKELERFATFEAAFPDDSAEDQDGNVTVPAGRNIAEALCDRLRELGVTPTAAAQHKFYGWAFEFPVGGLHAWVLLQYVEPWLLIVEARAGLLTPRRRRDTVAHQAIAILDSVLRQDSRFGKTLWMTQQAFEELGRRPASHV